VNYKRKNYKSRSMRCYLCGSERRIWRLARKERRQLKRRLREEGE